MNWAMVKPSIVLSCLEKCSHRESALSAAESFRPLTQKLVSRHPGKCRDLLMIVLGKNNSDSKTSNVCMCAVGSGTRLLNMEFKYFELVAKTLIERKSILRLDQLLLRGAGRVTFHQNFTHQQQRYSSTNLYGNVIQR